MLVALALPPAPAAGDPIPDASCPGPREAGFGSALNRRHAQTFTAQNSGSLTSAQIDVTKAGASANWVMQIVELDATGTPTNNVLASATVLDSTVPSGDSIITGTFASPATVTAGQQYALLLTRPGSAASFGIRDGDCPGALFQSLSQTGPFTPSPGVDDMVFSVFVEPPASPAPETAKVDRTLTLDANKNKVNRGKKVLLSGRVNELVRQGPCESGQTIELQRKRPSQANFTTFAQVQTDPQGSFSLKKRVKKTFEYRAQVPETTTCGGQVSNTEKVKVKRRR